MSIGKWSSAVVNVRSLIPASVLSAALVELDAGLEL